MLGPPSIRVTDGRLLEFLARTPKIAPLPTWAS